jgi:hypothetical protein
MRKQKIHNTKNGTLRTAEIRPELSTIGIKGCRKTYKGVERHLGKKRPEIEVEGDESQQRTHTGRRKQEASPKHYRKCTTFWL